MGSRRSIFASALIVVSSLTLPQAPALAVQGALCGDVQLIHARGTGAVIDQDPFYVEVSDKLDDRLGASISYSQYQLGKDGGFGGFAYPAAGRSLSSPVRHQRSEIRLAAPPSRVG